MDALRASFLEMYANLPSAIRDDIVVVVDEKTYTWNAVYTEVISKTNLGDKMLNTLNEMGII
jgi:hypothetical protein